MKKQAEIWLVIPVYNAGRYLAECLESVRSQSFTDFRVVVVDDGSTDGSRETADRFAAADSRFTVVSTPNKGVSAARNLGIDMAEGRYIGFVDADDCLLPGALETLHSCAVERGAQVVVGAMVRGERLPNGVKPVACGPRLMNYSEAMEQALYQKIILNSPCGMLMERRLLGETVRYREGIRFEDLDSFYRFYEGSGRIAWLDTPVYFYRRNMSSFINSWDESRLDSLEVTDRMVEYMAEHHPELKKGAEDRRFSAHYNMLLMLRKYRVEGRGDIVKRCKEVIRGYRRAVLFNPKSRLKNRIGALLSWPLLPFLCRKN